MKPYLQPFSGCQFQNQETDDTGHGGDIADLGDGPGWHHQLFANSGDIIETSLWLMILDDIAIPAAWYKAIIPLGGFPLYWLSILIQ